MISPIKPCAPTFVPQSLSPSNPDNKSPTCRRVPGANGNQPDGTPLDSRQIKNTDYDGKTPLHIATVDGTPDIIKKILQKNPAIIDAQDSQGNTALSLAIQLRHNKNAQVLLEHKADPNIPNNVGDAPIHHTCENRDLVAWLLLINAKVDIYQENSTGNPMAVAIENNSKPILMHMLKEDIYDLKNGEDQVILNVIEAINNGDICIYDNKELLVMLLQKLNSIGWKDFKGRNATMHLLMLCDISDNLSRSELLDILFEDSTLQDNYKNNLWYFVAINGHADLFSYLLQKDIDINSANNKGITPFLATCEKVNHKKLLESLVQHGADPKICDDRGFTALHMYALNKQVVENICLFLLQYISIDSISKSGNTALHIAAQTANLPLVSILTKYDADTRQQDQYEQTALDYAQTEFEEIKKLEKSSDLSKSDLIKKENYSKIIEILEIVERRNKYPICGIS